MYTMYNIYAEILYIRNGDLILYFEVTNRPQGQPCK